MTQVLCLNHLHVSGEICETCRRIERFAPDESPRDDDPDDDDPEPDPDDGPWIVPQPDPDDDPWLDPEPDPYDDDPKPDPDDEPYDDNPEPRPDDEPGDNDPEPAPDDDISIWDFDPDDDRDRGDREAGQVMLQKRRKGKGWKKRAGKRIIINNINNNIINQGKFWGNGRGMRRRMPRYPKFIK